MYARESFTIAEVADLLSIRRLSDSYQDEFPVECPFCGDLRGKCSFCIRKNGELKNVYHCYHCGAAGNMLTLYAELSGIYGRNRYKEAYREIKQELSFSGTDKRQQSTTRNGFVSIVSKKKRISLTEEEWDYRDHVYKEMLTFLKLKETHRRNLLLRGLTLNEVRQMEERGFLSTDEENSVAIARKLLKKGFRLDVPLKERKYLWFTSSGLEKGTSSGSPAGMFGKIKDGTVYVTEGILKAEIAWMCTGNPYIGVPGVSNHKGLETVLRKLKEQGLKRVYECYDMDKMMELSCKHDEKSACRQCEHGIYLYHGECPRKRRKRDMIRKGCIKLYEICEELNVSCKRVTWDTDASGTWMEQYKGVDDWILQKEEKGNRKTA